MVSYFVQDFSLLQRKMILLPGTQQLDIQMPFSDEIKYTILAISVLLFLIAVGILIWQVQKCCTKVHYSKDSGESHYVIRLWKNTNFTVKSWSWGSFFPPQKSHQFILVFWWAFKVYFKATKSGLDIRVNVWSDNLIFTAFSVSNLMTEDELDQSGSGSSYLDNQRPGFKVTYLNDTGKLFCWPHLLIPLSVILHCRSLSVPNPSFNLSSSFSTTLVHLVTAGLTAYIIWHCG